MDCLPSITTNRLPPWYRPIETCSWEYIFQYEKRIFLIEKMNYKSFILFDKNNKQALLSNNKEKQPIRK
jgi:hypothetical protein